MVILKWKKECLKIVPVLGKDSSIIKNVRLFFGVNEVSEADWAGMKVHLVDSIESGDLVVLVDDKAQFSELEVKKATALVGEMVNPDSLQGLLKKETRSEVRLAVVRRMKELGIVEDTADLKEDVETMFKKTTTKKANVGE